MGGIVAHLTQGGIAQSQHAAQQATASQQYRERAGSIEGSLSYNPIVVEYGNGNHYGSRHSSYKALQKI